MKRSAARGNKWQDHYSQRARKERYPARSVYKLQEIQKKYQLIKKGYKVLDLGCFPGSWLLYAAQQSGSSGEVIGIDLKPITIQVPSNVKMMTADVLQLDDDALDKNFRKMASDEIERFRREIIERTGDRRQAENISDQDLLFCYDVKAK